jgi:hypothetical protein
MSTNVPSPVLGPTGFIVPQESAILIGVQADYNAAFGGNLNPALNTPQGQLATSESAVIADANAQFLAITNGIDPAYASGRMQDAIGRIYFMTRIAAASTVVTATCNGLPGTILPIGAKAVDQAGNIYDATEVRTIPTPALFQGSISGSVLTVTSMTSGVIQSFQYVTGSTTSANTIITAQTSGTPGGAGTYTVNNSQSVGAAALRSIGVGVTFACELTGPVACPVAQLDAIYQAIPGWDTIYNAVDGVLGNDVESRADFEFRRAASVAVNARGSYDAVLGAVLAVPNVLDAYVVGNGSGDTSGATINGTISGFVLTNNSLTAGTVAIGQTVTGAGVAQGTYITNGSDPTWTVNISQSVGPEAMVCAQGGYQLAPHSIYVGVYGGSSTDIAAAILNKISPGCGFNGNTTVSVQDTTPPLASPYPTYHVTYNTLTPTAVVFTVSMLNNTQVPADAVAQIQASIIATFTGANGGQRARCGSVILHSSFYAGLFALGSWVQILEIQLGVGIANASSILMQIDQEPTITASDIAVTFT